MLKKVGREFNAVDDGDAAGIEDGGEVSGKKSISRKGGQKSL